jgi:hypothetical protein
MADLGGQEWGWWSGGIPLAFNFPSETGFSPLGPDVTLSNGLPFWEVGMKQISPVGHTHFSVKNNLE